MVSAASCYTAEFWSATPVVLCVVGTTSTSVSARSTPQNVLLRLRLALRSPLTCRAAVLKVCSALHLVWSHLGFHANPNEKSVVKHLSKNMAMTLWCHSDAGPSTSTFGHRRDLASWDSGSSEAVDDRGNTIGGSIVDVWRLCFFDVGVHRRWWAQAAGEQEPPVGPTARDDQVLVEVALTRMCASVLRSI